MVRPPTPTGSTGPTGDRNQGKTGRNEDHLVDMGPRSGLDSVLRSKTGKDRNLQGSKLSNLNFKSERLVRHIYSIFCSMISISDLFHWLVLIRMAIDFDLIILRIARSNQKTYPCSINSFLLSF